MCNDGGCMRDRPNEDRTGPPRRKTEQDPDDADQIVDVVDRICSAIAVLGLEIADRHAVPHPTEVVIMPWGNGRGVGIAEQTDDRTASIGHRSTRVHDDDADSLICEGIGAGNAIGDRCQVGPGLDMERALRGNALPPSADVVAGRSCGCGQCVDRNRCDPGFHVCD